MTNHKPYTPAKAKTKREPFNLSGIEREIIILALNGMKEEIAKFQDKQQEYGPDLTIKEYDIEMLQDYMRYG